MPTPDCARCVHCERRSATVSLCRYFGGDAPAYPHKSRPPWDSCGYREGQPAVQGLTAPPRPVARCPDCSLRPIAGEVWLLVRWDRGERGSQPLCRSHALDRLHKPQDGQAIYSPAGERHPPREPYATQERPRS